MQADILQYCASYAEADNYTWIGVDSIFTLLHNSNQHYYC